MRMKATRETIKLFIFFRGIFPNHSRSKLFCLKMLGFIAIPPWRGKSLLKFCAFPNLFWIRQ